MTGQQDFEVIIIGGSYAGLSAAMALGRSLRTVLIIDAGLPCNKQTPHSHNFITQDGEQPSVITSRAKEQVLAYSTVQYLSGEVVGGERIKNGFTIATKDNGKFNAQKLIFATGIKDLMPDIKGFKECWGISVVHCPYCHGYELRNQKTGIIANADHALHLASLVKNLTDNIVILTSGKADFSKEELAKLAKYNIDIVEKEILAIGHTNGKMQDMIFRDGSNLYFDAAYAAVPFKQHTDLPATLGCTITEHGYIEVDDFQKTTIDGVYACGDNSTRMRSIANAVYQGNVAGAVINNELTHELF